MERESTKHGGRLDDEMKAETRPLTTGAPAEGHTRDDRTQEDMPDDPALVEGSWRGETTSGSAPDPAEVEIRAELARRLAGVGWPAKGSEIAARLREPGTEGELAGVLPDHLPDRIEGLGNASFDHFQALWDALHGAAAA